MIDAEEVFESAAETGYRLCSAGEEVVEDGSARPDRLFSAHWDANNSKRVFACTQDGMLKVAIINQFMSILPALVHLYLL